MTERESLLKVVLTLGFDRSAMSSRGVRFGCSRCAVQVVRGAPIHEEGCPNENYECLGCFARVPIEDTYCEDCK